MNSQNHDRRGVRDWSKSRRQLKKTLAYIKTLRSSSSFINDNVEKVISLYVRKMQILLATKQKVELVLNKCFMSKCFR